MDNVFCNSVQNLNLSKIYPPWSPLTLPLQHFSGNMSLHVNRLTQLFLKANIIKNDNILSQLQNMHFYLRSKSIEEWKISHVLTKHMERLLLLQGGRERGREGETEEGREMEEESELGKERGKEGGRQEGREREREKVS